MRILVSYQIQSKQSPFASFLYQCLISSSWFGLMLLQWLETRERESWNLTKKKKRESWSLYFFNWIFKPSIQRKIGFFFFWRKAKLVYIIILDNNPRLARNVIINFIIFNKNTLNLFNLDIGSVLSYFLVFNLLQYNYYFKLIFILVYSVIMFDFLLFR